MLSQGRVAAVGEVPARATHQEEHSKAWPPATTSTARATALCDGGPAADGRWLLLQQPDEAPVGHRERQPSERHQGIGDGGAPHLALRVAATLRRRVGDEVAGGLPGGETTVRWSRESSRRRSRGPPREWARDVLDITASRASESRSTLAKGSTLASSSRCGRLSVSLISFSGAHTRDGAPSIAQAMVAATGRYVMARKRKRERP